MNNTEKFWSGKFGDDYTDRNRVNWRARVPFWDDIVTITGARSIFEFGCNAGWNLSAIQRLNRNITLRGCDVNQKALNQAKMAGLDVDFGNINNICQAELIFTAGVLIHIDQDNIIKTMQKIVDQSFDYVLAVEYEAKDKLTDKDIHAEEVEYRGYKGKLWRRGYGYVYERLGLKTELYMQTVYGFDNCSAWLMRKK